MKPRQLVFAFASLLPEGGAPAEIVYFPEGEHSITATVDGRPQTVTVKVPPARGAQIAAGQAKTFEAENKSAHVQNGLHFRQIVGWKEFKSGT